MTSRNGLPYGALHRPLLARKNAHVDVRLGRGEHLGTHPVFAQRIFARDAVRGAVVATIFNVEIGFEVNKSALIAQVFDVDDGRGDVMAEVGVDDDGVVGGFGHGSLGGVAPMPVKPQAAAVCAAALSSSRVPSLLPLWPSHAWAIS